MLAAIYFPMYLQLKCERLLANTYICLCELKLWSRLCLRRSIWGRGRKPLGLTPGTCWQKMQMIQSELQDFIVTNYWLGQKWPPVARRELLLGKEHQTGTVRGVGKQTSQRGPETELCCSMQKLTIRMRVDNPCVELSVCQTLSPWTGDSQQLSQVGWREIKATFPRHLPRARPELPRLRGHVGFARQSFSSGSGEV